MRWFRYAALLLLPSLIASPFWLSGAFGQQGTPPTKAPNPPQAPPSTTDKKPTEEPKAPPPPKADDQATKTLSTAIDLLDPKKVGWVETTLWQQIEAPGFAFHADGNYLSGPNRQVRLQLNVKLGGTDGELLVISDGATVWNAIRVGKDEPVVTKWDLKAIQQQLNAPGTMPQMGEEFYKSQTLAGISPLLQSLKQQLVFTKQERERWKNHDVLKLTGVWSADITKMLAKSAAEWPVLVPRSCKLYLDATTYWPYRVEWWGPTGPRTEDSLLMQTEFRDPHFTKPDGNPTAFAGRFTYQPGKATVVDRTKEMSDQIVQLRNRQPPPGQRGPGATPGGAK